MNYYDEIAQGYDGLHKEEQLKKLTIIRDNLKITEDDSLLDVGCGTGISTEFWNCKNKTGIDPSRGLLDHTNNKNTKYIQAFAESIPFPDNSFDVVISLTAIQNFTDFSKGLDEIRRVGKKRFALTVLKRSSKMKEIREYILSNFNITNHIIEDKDEIFISD